MMSDQQSISCPNCQHPIYFDAQMLLSGAKFTCSACNSSIGLAQESKPKFEQVMDQFIELKDETAKKK